MVDLQIIDVLNNMNKEIVANNFMLKRLLAKVDTIETNQKIINNQQIYSTLNEVYIEPEFFSQYPNKNSDEFALLENCVKNEPEYSLKLEKFIKSIGGKNLKNNINRVLSKVFSNEFAIECSWTGRGKNIKIKLGETAIMHLIKNIMKGSFLNTFNESDFEKGVADWLRHANTRFSRMK